MKTMQVFDKPMCCSTGVCGPDVDPVLPRFAADLEWLKTQGHRVERFNLAQEPQAFVENPEIHKLLSTQGTDFLPAIIVDGRLVSQNGYPTREVLSVWMAPDTASYLPQIVDRPGGCCGGPKSC
ncbi:MAG: arsenical resistance operon transcriptional repressor ArsD [Pirellula sp.]|nr:arsenical resistance operon transcriptional repressor ArsD [Pirellula sp.]